MQLPKSYQQKITKACAEAMLEAIHAFPDLLARSSAESAAAIVALLLRDQLSGSPEEADPLQDLVKRLAEEDGYDPDSPVRA